MPTLSRPDFKYQHLWQQAMTHRSFANEQANDIPHNERLEFLGDAILTFLSGDYLYARYPDKSEGELTTISSNSKFQGTDRLNRFCHLNSVRP